MDFKLIQSFLTATPLKQSTLTTPYIPTIIDAHSIQHIQNDSRILLKLTEVGGAFQEHSRLVISQADAFMICYDVGCRLSFDACWGKHLSNELIIIINIQGLFESIIDIKRTQTDTLAIMLVGSKIDKIASGDTDRQVTSEMGKQLASNMGALVNQTHLSTNLITSSLLKLLRKQLKVSDIALIGL